MNEEQTDGALAGVASADLLALVEAQEKLIAQLEKDKSFLLETGEKLVRWVEAPRHNHEEVRDHNGRLKDTGIWASFYVAVRGIQRKDSPVPLSKCG